MSHVLCSFFYTDIRYNRLSSWSMMTLPSHRLEFLLWAASINFGFAHSLLFYLSPYACRNATNIKFVNHFKYNVKRALLRACYIAFGIYTCTHAYTLMRAHTLAHTNIQAHIKTSTRTQKRTDTCSYTSLCK